MPYSIPNLSPLRLFLTLPVIAFTTLFPVRNVGSYKSHWQLPWVVLTVFYQRITLPKNFCSSTYGVPRENVIGSNMKLSWEYRDGAPVLVRQAGLVEPFNDGPGKPINIQLHVGRHPILTGGNSNGDVPMMEFAAASGKPYLNLLVHHDDAEREYASDHSAEQALKTAKERNWTIISMKEDFAIMFPE